MGYKEIDVAVRTDYEEKELKNKIGRSLNIGDFSYSILRKSLDARNKRNIHWLIKVGVESDVLSGGSKPSVETLVFPERSSGERKKAVVTGCGPAGLFAALVLQRSGVDTVLIDKGSDVKKRIADIEIFEKTGNLKKNSGYPFGAGGAGTFSDGKITSRTKSITLEKNFIYKELIKAGAPTEIKYLTHPHLGTSNLRKIVSSLISEFISAGGNIFFETEVTSFRHKNRKIISVETEGKHTGEFDGNIFVFAPGQSSFDFYRTLMKGGFLFENKPFAIGFRVEHLREEINISQWGVRELPGVKAAEYRLTAKCEGGSVFTFCMCPGGKIVQASPRHGLSVVNGMSDYDRNGKFSNSAVVTSFNVEHITGRTVSPLESLDILEKMERTFFEFNNSFALPAMTISDLLCGRTGSLLPSSYSYPLGLISCDFYDIFPSKVLSSLVEGLKIFNRKISCFENGVAAGLESKTSSPVKAVRTANFSTPPFANAFICGEGSGHAGGIMSSAADGIKIATSILSGL